MKNVLFAVAAVAVLAVTARPAAAQYPAPGYGPPAYGPPGYGPVVQAGCTQCDGGSGYGGHGWGFGLKDKFLGHLHGLFGNHGGGRSVTDLPVVDPRSGNAGQLAFPQNPFWRGPRDYFMWDER
jgi:hypothetical protein